MFASLQQHVQARTALDMLAAAELGECMQELAALAQGRHVQGRQPRRIGLDVPGHAQHPLPVALSRRQAHAEQLQGPLIAERQDPGTVHAPFRLAQQRAGAVVFATDGGDFRQAQAAMQDEWIGGRAGVAHGIEQYRLARRQRSAQHVDFPAQQEQPAEQQVMLPPAALHQMQRLVEQDGGALVFAGQQFQANEVAVDQHLAGQAFLAPGQFEGGLHQAARFLRLTARHRHPAQGEMAKQGGTTVVVAQPAQRGLTVLTRRRGIAAQALHRAVQGLPIGQQANVACGALLRQVAAEPVQAGLRLVQASSRSAGTKAGSNWYQPSRAGTGCNSDCFCSRARNIAPPPCPSHSCSHSVSETLGRWAMLPSAACSSASSRPSNSRCRNPRSQAAASLPSRRASSERQAPAHQP
ncbi:hypothetical protein D9M70_438900 [compost metagenome]